jgi:hypothetical protein
VTAALRSLPWVEPNSIKADVKIRQVKFTVSDKSSFDLEAAREAIKKKGYDDVSLLVGPT